VKALYTYRHSDVAAPLDPNAVQEACAPYATPGLDAQLRGVVAGPQTDADKINWTPEKVTLNLVSDAGPTPTFKPYAYIVMISAENTVFSPGSPLSITKDGELSLQLVGGLWKVTLVSAQGADGPSSNHSGQVNASDPAAPPP